VSRLTPRWILVGAWVVFVLFGYPGYMRPDALDELSDSRTGTFTDWHSPMLTELWRVLGRLIAGPAPLFLLQGTMVLLGVYALARRVVPDRRAAGVAAVLLLFPPLLSTTVLVSEDATLAAFLVCGAALLLSNRRLSGLALLVVAAGLHAGAPLAVLPILVATLRRPAITARWKALATALVAWAAVTGLALGLTQLLVDEHTHRREAALAVVDLAGTLGHAHHLEDAEIRALLPGVSFAVVTDLQQHARKASQASPDAGANRVFETPTTRTERDGLIEGREAISRALPLAYLGARVQVFERVLGFSRDKQWRTSSTDFVPNPKVRLRIAHAAHHSLIQRILIWPVKLISKTLLFRPYVYFVLGLVLVPVSYLRRHGLAAMVLVSGLGYELGLGLVTAVPEYRASHWMMVASCFAALLVALEVRDERLEQQAPVGAAEHDRGA
jgi:hypothetical protein